MTIGADRSIHFMTLDRIDVMAPTPYMLRKEPKRLPWLARLCWKLLHRLNALEMYSETVTKWTYTKAAKKTLTEMVWAMRDELEYYFEEPSKYVVVVGAHDFQEALHSPAIRGAMCFEVGPFGTNRPYQRVFDFDVWVVPRMQGMAVLPRAVIEREVQKFPGLAA